jgi:general L-amino acid transport system permease protein
VIGIVLATFLGTTIGIFRLSDNWLVQKLATVYVEVFRNTPLLLQLFFWYFAVFLKLPPAEKAITLPGAVSFSNLGLSIPWPGSSLGLFFLILSLIFGLLIGRRRTQAIVRQGRAGKVFLWILGAIAVISLSILIFGLNWQKPQFESATSSFVGGLTLAPELATLVIGLTFYTAAFIAEVVRAGIQSVDRGQWEAARALGLKPHSIMQLVILPQALRVIIPPLTSEFLNLGKNSSLAIAIGYNDVYGIANTVANQTGRSIEMLIVVMSAYLIFNLLISITMNGLNRLVQIQEK